MIECKECNKNIPNESKFCAYCGTVINSIPNQINSEFIADDEIEAPKIDINKNSSQIPNGRTEEIESNNSESEVKVDLAVLKPKFDAKPILQLIALLVVVGVLLAIIWK